MSHFIPSDYGDVAGAYGADEAADGGSQQQAAQALEQYAPAISALLFGGDPREKYEKKKAALANYTNMYNKAPSSFLRNIYAMKIRSLQAEIRALEELVGEERAAVITTQAGKISGAVLLAAGALTALLIGNYVRQKTKTEKMQRRLLQAQLK